MAPNPLNSYGLVASMAPNPINLYGLVASMAPNHMNSYGLVASMAPNPINLYGLVTHMVSVFLLSEPRPPHTLEPGAATWMHKHVLGSRLLGERGAWAW